MTALDTTSNTITVWDDVNDAGQHWLDAHGDPNPVTISLVGDQIEVGDGGHEGGAGDGGDSAANPPDEGSGGLGATAGATIQPGDRVEVEATTSADGNNLIAGSRPRRTRRLTAGMPPTSHNLDPRRPTIRSPGTPRERALPTMRFRIPFTTQLSPT